MSVWRHPPTDSRVRLGARVALLVGVPVLVAAAGVLTVINPPPSVADGATSALRLAWSACLVLGGALTLAGMCRRCLRPQLAGRVLVAGGAGFYAVHLCTAPDGLPVAALMGALALSSLGEAFQHADLARWQRADRDRSRRAHPANRGGGGRLG